MKILFLHGWTSVPGGRKPTFFIDAGHIVLNPALPDEDFEEAVRIAQAEYDQDRPDALIGSSRGGAVAMNIESVDTPLVLLCVEEMGYCQDRQSQHDDPSLQSRRRCALWGEREARQEQRVAGSSFDRHRHGSSPGGRSAVSEDARRVHVLWFGRWMKVTGCAELQSLDASRIANPYRAWQDRRKPP